MKRVAVAQHPKDINVNIGSAREMRSDAVKRRGKRCGGRI